MIDFLTTRLRSNPRFTLVPYDRLQGAGSGAVRPLSSDPEFFGILTPPPGSALPAKSVSRDAALLFMALREPACLPHLLRSLFGQDIEGRLVPLILDGVFEFEHGGAFRSGADALARLGDRGPAPGASRVTRLCTEAIAYAAALQALPAHEIADRLYRFNSIPGRAELYRRFGSDEELLAFLFKGNGIERRLRSRWRGQPIGDSWLLWEGDGESGTPAYKLYVSAAPEHLPEVFEAAVEAFSQARCARFKLGRGPFGLLRPDKLVAYFAGLDRLQQAAELIRSAAGGAAAHGVPFTAPIDPEGLLSWGMDPPRFEQVLPWQQVQSWRQWLTHRVAVCVLAAREADADVQSFVRARLRLDGVDTDTWSPDLAIWRGPVGTVQEAA